MDYWQKLYNVPPFLTALERKDSFAYKTLTERVPNILKKAINHLELTFENEKANFDQDDRDIVISKLNDLLRELLSNSQLRPLKGSHDLEDWNSYWLRNDLQYTWHSASMLLAECYLYLRIKESFISTKSL
jgi:hypothetical protein